MLLLFAKRSFKNLGPSKEFSWFDYGAYYKKYSDLNETTSPKEECEGIAIRHDTRFFEPSTGKVWINPENILVCIAKSLKETQVEPDTAFLVLNNREPRCDYLVNPLCTGITFYIPEKLVKLSKQYPVEFVDVLSTKGLLTEKNSYETRKTKEEEEKLSMEIYRKYFKS